MIVPIEQFIFLSDLSNAACYQCLRQHDIKAILTIDSQPRAERNQPCTDHVNQDDDEESQMELMRDRFLKLHDDHGNNLLELLPQCLEFITNSLKNEKNVLVHCLAGVSRSASVVIAYVMKTRNLSFQDAFEMVKAKKVDVMPNPCFIYQLKVFDKMERSFDMESPHYKLFLTKLEQYHRMAAQGKHEDNFWSIPCNSQPVKSNISKKSVTYKCRSCRILLFTSNDLCETHSEDSSLCTSLYLNEPLDWMKKSMTSDVQGKILCFKCSAKIGMFNWSGRTCSCGAWITPSFQIQKARVDQSFPK